jgi:transposase
MPGAGKQPPEIQDQIKELLEAGFDPTTIHRRLKVGRSSIYRMKRCLEQHGTNYMPKEMNKKNGRPKVLTPEQELVSRRRAPFYSGEILSKTDTVYV